MTRIKNERADLERFIASNVPRKRRLLNVTIIGGAVAAALTAGPAFGGLSFTDWLSATFGLPSPSWQLLCGVAAGCSIAATVATQILKSQNIEQHVAQAQHCRAKLEVLEVGLETEVLDSAQASQEFLRCLEDAAFLKSL